MALNGLALDVLKHVQDKKKFCLSESEERFGKSASTIKRTVTQINNHMPGSHRLTIKNNCVNSTIPYDVRLEIVGSLDFSDYVTTTNERLSLLLFTSFFEGAVNMTKLYEKIGVSRSTRKKDRNEMLDFFSPKKLEIKTMRGYGIEVVGEEATQRMYIARKLTSMLEFGSDDVFRKRKANSPVDNKLSDIFLKATHSLISMQQEKMLHFLEQENLRADYASRKLLLIYFIIGQYRINQQKRLAYDDIPQVLPVDFYHFFEETLENRYMNLILSSLNYKEALQFPLSPMLRDFSNQLVAEVQRNIVTQFVTYEELENACYSYLYKCLIKNELGYLFYDDKLETTKIEFPLIVQIIEAFIAENYYEGQELLKETQIATLSLIFSTYILRNKVYKSDKKQIVIITNSSSEKINFFVEELKKYVDFELLDYLTLNELQQLENLKYDAVITFSSRITTVMEKQGYDVIRMPFYLEESHAKLLYDYGFPSNCQRKLLKKVFIEEIKGKTDEELDAFLSDTYDQYFI